MIPFDLEYYAPTSIDEAVDLYSDLEKEKKQPLYYAGGTEIVTLCRHQTIRPGALIDIKEIYETVIFEPDGERFVFGANLTLSGLSEQDHFPLLASVAGGVADRTVRNRLTLGGNICGRLPYREAVLPFLLGGAEAMLAGPQGRRSVPLLQHFDKRLRLGKGEMLVQLTIPASNLKAKSWRKRRERHGPVDYPLLHLAVLEIEEKLAAAVSGLCAFPFRSEKLESLLNDPALSIQEKVEQSTELLPGPVRADEMGSADYRRALWLKDLAAMLNEMGGRGR